MLQMTHIVSHLSPQYEEGNLSASVVKVLERKESQETGHDQKQSKDECIIPNMVSLELPAKENIDVFFNCADTWFVSRPIVAAYNGIETSSRGR